MKSSTESLKAVLQDPRDKCAGNLKLFYSGAWYPLCTNSIDKNTQNAICEYLSCGEALSFNESISSMSNIHGLKKFTCHDGGISNCDVSQTEIGQCKVGHLKCKGIHFTRPTFFILFQENTRHWSKSSCWELFFFYSLFSLHKTNITAYFTFGEKI